MRVQRAYFRPYRLDLKRPLKTALGEFNYRDGLVLTLQADDGARGLGDASPVPGYSVETLSRAEADLRSFCKGNLKELEFGSLAAIEEFCEELDVCASAKNAIEQALVDLLAKAKNLPLSKLLSADAQHRVETGALVTDLLQAKTLWADGFRILKIKVGARPIEEDKQFILSVLEELPDGLRLRLDANRSLGYADATYLLSNLESEQIEFIEEPLLPELCGDLKKLREQSAILIALDESIVDESSLKRALRENWCDIVVIKPMMCGGPLTALKFAKLAASHSVDCAFTSSLESVIGRLGTLHTAAAAPRCRAAGLNTGILFEKDLAPGPKLIEGFFVLPTQPGIGVALQEGL